MHIVSSKQVYETSKYIRASPTPWLNILHFYPRSMPFNCCWSVYESAVVVSLLNAAERARQRGFTLALASVALESTWPARARAAKRNTRARACLSVRASRGRDGDGCRKRSPPATTALGDFVTAPQTLSADARANLSYLRARSCTSNATTSLLLGVSSSRRCRCESIVISEKARSDTTRHCAPFGGLFECSFLAVAQASK